ncbi:MAG: glutathione S-transferase family protein [Parasphingopyxis sp.]|nr:glutathione S-transferase [Sphingomonadales bacterium]
MTITVHHLENSRSQRILWLLEELGLDYAVRRYERDKSTMLAPPELKQVHPLGKSPVIVDEDAERPRTLIETGAIVEYLVARAGGELGAPSHVEEALRYRQFLHYAEGSMMPPLLAILVIDRLGMLGKPARKPMLSMFAQHLEWLEGEIAGRPWFAGESFTAADVMMSFPLEAARQRAGLDDRYPHLLAWLEKIHARPAWQRALDRGGDYAFA